MPFPVTSTSQLGDLLKGLRKSRKMTQSDVARASGLRQKTVSLLENAPQRCSVDSLLRYLSAVRANASLDLQSDLHRPVTGDSW